jgi:hypothetical protein
MGRPYGDPRRNHSAGSCAGVWSTSGAHMTPLATITQVARRPARGARPSGKPYPYDRYCVQTQYSPYEHSASSANQTMIPAPPPRSKRRLVPTTVRTARASEP